jgi:hypothetical protein
LKPATTSSGRNLQPVATTWCNHFRSFRHFLLFPAILERNPRAATISARSTGCVCWLVHKASAAPEDQPVKKRTDQLSAAEKAAWQQLARAARKVKEAQRKANRSKQRKGAKK